MANNDAADWLGELLLEAVLDNPDKNDYIKIAKSSAKTSTELWAKMSHYLEKNRTPHTTHKPLEQYVGTYHNLIADWKIEAFLKDGTLQMCFQGNTKQTYCLEHYHYNVFSWLLTRDEVVHRGRFPVTVPDCYLIEFRASAKGSGKVDQLTWKPDPDVPDGEIFFKHPLM